MNKVKLDLDHVVCCVSSARYIWWQRKRLQATATSPGKFDDGDFDAWLREFDACSAANGWKVTEASDAKILKLPAFLRGRAASNFYAIPEGERRTYADAVKAMRRALCPPAKRENFFAEFELRALRPDEDPSVYKWELENILSKADPTLSNDAKTALLTRQFSRGLPPTLKLKMLEHNPTPTLNEMVEFTKRFRALGQPVAAEIPPVKVDAVAHSSSPADPKLQELITMVAVIAEKQQALENRLKRTENTARILHLVRRRLDPAIRVVYQVILLEIVRDSEALVQGGQSPVIIVENRDTSRESVDHRVI